MLFRVDREKKTAAEVAPSHFSELAVKERWDIQEWVIESPELLGEDLLVVATEYDQFDSTSERLDILAVDHSGKLVVIELKRTAVGTKADLQALRYAAFCSTLAAEDVVELYSDYIRRSEGEESSEGARKRLFEFIDDPEFEEFDDKPRIIIAAEEFPQEMTATLLWLRSFELDISAVRLRPYQLGTELLVDSSVLIPLPEAEEYLVRRERKDSQQAGRVRGKGALYQPWFQALIDELREVHDFTGARKAQASNWYSFASGLGGNISYGAVFTGDNRLRAEVYLDVGEKVENKRIFDALYEQRDEFQQPFAVPLAWERLDEGSASRVGLYRDVTITAPQDELEEARSWMIEQLLELKKVFGPAIEQLLAEDQ